MRTIYRRLQLNKRNGTCSHVKSLRNCVRVRTDDFLNRQASNKLLLITQLTKNVIGMFLAKCPNCVIFGMVVVNDIENIFAKFQPPELI